MSNISLETLFLILFILIVLSAFFSGSETALMTINRYRLKHKKEQGHRGAKLVYKLLQRPDQLIGLILLGNNFINILASSIATLIALRLGGESAIALSTGLLTLVILIFSEVTPKTLAALRPERVAYPAAYIYTPLMKLLYPFVWVLNQISKHLLSLLGVSSEQQINQSLSQEELRTVVMEAGALLPPSRRKMLLGILDLGKTAIDEIMIPRTEMRGIDMTQPLDNIRKQFHNSHYTRLPLYEKTIDNIVGIIHIRDAMHIMARGDFSLDSINHMADAPYFIPEGTSVNKQLLNFQRDKRRLGIVVDEYGDLLGLVSMADLLEEIVGEFTTDPSDNHQDIHPQEDGSYLITGNANLREIKRQLDWDLDTRSARTLNGLVLEHLEDIPEVGISFILSDRPIEIVQIHDNAVKMVKVGKIIAR